FVLMILGLPLFFRVRDPYLAAGGRQSGRRMALVFAICALLTALACEAGYVRDLFDGGPLARMNTVFKLYRVAWLLLALAASSWMEDLLSPSGSAVRLNARPSRGARLRLIVGRALACLVLGTSLVYPVCGSLAWLRGRATEARRLEGATRAALLPGADAEALFRARMPGAAAAAD